MPRKVNELQKKEILNLFVNGTNIKDISKIYNFTISTITRQLKTLIDGDEFIKFKNFNNKNKKIKKNNKIIIETNLIAEDENFIEEKEVNTENNDFDILGKQDKLSGDSLFVELTPIEYEIENSKQKDLSSIPLSDVDFPKVVYMIVDQKIELEIKFLRDYPEWQFLSQEELNRKTIKIYFDLKSAKSQCNKNQKVIKVPNTEVFKIASPILISRGISRIVSSDLLIAL